MGLCSATAIRYYKSVSRASSKVFISYSTDAKPWAETLAESLERKGVSTWTDFNSVRPGDRWLKEMQLALDAASYFLIVVGPKNQIGEWQDREWQGVLHSTWEHPEKRVIPILIADATLPAFLKNWVSIRVQPDESESSWIDKVYNSVRGADSERSGTPAKQNIKSDSALRSRLKQMTTVVKQLKANRE